MTKIVYIRNDDVYRLDKTFLKVFRLFKKYKIPLVYAVIPKPTTKELAAFLNREKEKNPGLLDIVQHGWSHANHNRGIGPKFEFGRTRSARQQEKDIVCGDGKMLKLFGSNFTPAFVPPCHGYDQTTLRLINKLNIPIFSAGRPTGYKYRKFKELPTSFSLNDHDENGKYVFLGTHALIKKFPKILLGPGKFIGILFHHHTLRQSKDFKGLEDLLKYLSTLRKNKSIKFLLFSKIAVLDGSLPVKF